MSSGGGQPFQSDLPPFPQIAFGLVAAFSCVEAACNAKASSGEVAQLGPGSHESRRGAMKVKAGALAGRGGIPRPLQSAEGAPPARLARRAGEVEHERTC